MERKERNETNKVRGEREREKEGEKEGERGGGSMKKAKNLIG